MGIPVTAAYLITSELAVPILTSPEMGIPIVAAHLIIFWLSQDSNITPPVALGRLCRCCNRTCGSMENRVDLLQVRETALYHAAVVRIHTHTLFTEGTPEQYVLICCDGYRRYDHLLNRHDGLLRP